MTGDPWRSVRAIVWKDLAVVRRSPIILLPMILLPALLQIVFPVVLGLIAINSPESLSNDADLQQLLAQVPPNVAASVADQELSAQILILMLTYFFAPLYLIIPMMVASVIAADSFVGERERKTLEALLHAPIADDHLLLAKMLSAWLAAVTVSTAAFGAYAIVVNLVGYPFVGRVFFPNVLWLLLVFWVAPAVAGFGLSGTVLISARVKTFQEAYQIGGLVVVPLLALMLGQIGGAVFLGPRMAVVLGAVVWAANGLMFAFGRRVFQRERLLTRL